MLAKELSVIKRFSKFLLAFCPLRLYSEDMESSSHFLLLHITPDNMESSIIFWFGQYHYLFLHFPFACALLAGLAELLYSWTEKETYGFTAHFLLICTALFAIPTVLAGLALANATPIILWSDLWWHRTFGIATLIFSWLAAIFRFWPQHRKIYLCFLILLLICVEIAGDLGADMAFEHFHWLP